MLSNWESKIRSVKQVVWCRVHPKQEFRQIVVSEDLGREIKETIGTDIREPNSECTFEGISVTVDDRLPADCVVFIPSDPTKGETNG